MKIIKQGLSKRQKVELAKQEILNEFENREIYCDNCEANFSLNIEDCNKLKLKFETMYTLGGGIKVLHFIYKFKCPCCGIKMKRFIIVGDYSVYKIALKEIKRNIK